MFRKDPGNFRTGRKIITDPVKHKIERNRARKPITRKPEIGHIDDLSGIGEPRRGKPLRAMHPDRSHPGERGGIDKLLDKAARKIKPTGTKRVPGLDLQKTGGYIEHSAPVKEAVGERVSKLVHVLVGFCPCLVKITACLYLAPWCSRVLYRSAVGVSAYGGAGASRLVSLL
jgi:hypothetical protein